MLAVAKGVLLGSKPLTRVGMTEDVGSERRRQIAEDIVEPLVHRPQVIRSASLILGYAGVYSSFLMYTYRAAEKFQLDPRDILVELGMRGMVGGQKDMITNVAYHLA
jgi:4-hydroxy 2-oxovalerate aldolase